MFQTTIRAASEGFTCITGNTWGSGIDGDYCLTVSAEFFPLRILGDNYQTDSAAALGLNIAFGSGARIAQVLDCHFEGAACGINHAGNSASNEVISQNNTFDMASPYTFSGGATHAGIMRVEGDRANNTDPTIITPAQITANQNDYNPTGMQYARTLLLSTDASRTITGFQKGALDRRVAIFNVGVQSIVLASSSGSSAAVQSDVSDFGNANDSVRRQHDSLV